MKSFRYLISGGTAACVDLGTYFICLHYIFSSNSLYLGFITTPYACLIVSYSVGFVTNFTISKLFVFKTNNMRTRYQLFRFVIVTFIGFVLNYFFMKLLISLGSYPTVARLISMVMVSGLSYTLHKKFTFRVKH